jgi:hypothetical protein
MDHFAGLDVSVKDTSICIVDDAGRIVREVKLASEPEALLRVLGNAAYRFKRIGLEAGPLSQWLFSALVTAGRPQRCFDFHRQYDLNPPRCQRITVSGWTIASGPNSWETVGRRLPISTCQSKQIEAS